MTPLMIIGILTVILFLIPLMQTRTYYFVRHGETLMNAKHLKQGEEGELSPNGRLQAEQVGKDLKPLHVGQILSSPYPRAKETARIINSFLHVSVRTSPLLAERKNPSELIGRPTSDPEVVRIVDLIDNSYHDDAYRFSDEENFVDLKKRARKCVRFLILQSARETAVVTHHVILKMLLSYMLYGKRLHHSDYTKLSFFNVSDNAGISVVEFHPWKVLSKTGGWQVLTYNQQA